MSELKTLVTCKPTEFLKQTCRIKKAVEKWLTVTDILNIRKRLPALEMVPQNATYEERKAAVERNKKLAEEQTRKNLSEMFDVILGEHPDETLELLALCCFVEPEHIDDYKVSDYLSAFNTIISDEAVIGFFTSLASLEQMNILDASKA